MGITQRLVHVVAGGKATGKIGKPNTGGPLRSGVFDDSDVMRHGSDHTIQFLAYPNPSRLSRTSA